jgi:VWFA-related protein
MRFSRREFLGAIAIAAGAQQRPEFSTTLDVVNVFATARDGGGRIVSNLELSDFHLQEDGRPQPIRYFSRESDLPLTVGLLIDTSASTNLVQAAERDGARRFLQKVMRLDEDRAFVVEFASRVYVLRELTRNVDELSRAVELAGRPEAPGRELKAPARRGQPNGGTLLNEGVWCVANDVMQKQKLRKAIVVLSDGVDNGSAVSQATAVEAAQRADMMVYTILFESQDAWRPPTGNPATLPRPRPARIPTPLPRPARKIVTRGARALLSLSAPTGGLSFEVSEKLGLDAIFARIEEDLRHQYSLGYTPENPRGNGGYRRIRLTTRRHGVTLRTRDGYYA